MPLVPAAPLPTRALHPARSRVDMFAASSDSTFSYAPRSADSLLVSSSSKRTGNQAESMDTEMTSPTVSARSSCDNLAAAVPRSAGSTDGSESNEPADNRWADLEGE